MKKWTIGVLAVLILFSGCVKQTLEIDARLGAKRDGKSGFYAYYTARKSRPIESIKIYVASEDSLLKPVVTLGEEKEIIYPIAVEETRVILVPPFELVQILDAELGSCTTSRAYVEVGYFSNCIAYSKGFPGHYFEKVVDAFPGGLASASPKENLKKMIRKAMEECRLAAAEYGADAIGDVSVYYGEAPTGEVQSYGVWLYAKAIVFIEE